MKKNKNLTNEKKKKLPFNVFFKKGLASLMLAGVMIVSSIVLTGCKEGVDGKNGPQWYYSTVDVVDGTLDGTVDFTAVEGDFYIDTDGYTLYQLKNNCWTIIMENFGKPGTDGKDETNEQNENDGKDGISVYVGYDGYIWQGTTRTNYKLVENITSNLTIDNTLGLVNHNQYFTPQILDMGMVQVAPMQYYFKGCNKTNLSGLTIETLGVYSTKAGTLTVGTVGVDSFTKNISLGNRVTLNDTKTFDVKEGVNTLTLNILIGENDTLVLGGENDTASLIYYETINTDDELGEFACIKVGTIQNETIIKSINNSIENKLVSKIVIGNKLTELSEQQLLTENIQSLYASASFSDDSVYGSIDIKHTPVGYKTKINMFENAYIDKINIPVRSIDVLRDKQTFTISKYKIADISSSTSISSLTPTQKYVIEIDTSMFDATTDGTVNKWIPIDLLSYNIFVEEGETLFFSSATDTIGFLYSRNGTTNDQYSSIGAMYYTNNGTLSVFEDSEKRCLTLEVFGRKFVTRDVQYQNYIQKLIDKNSNILLKNILTNKQLSILGDSISTFEGFSNDGANTNSNITNNAVYYNSSKIDVVETYWKQLIDQYNMTLCVNNSWSASGVMVGDTGTTSGYVRATQLHDDTISNNVDNSVVDPNIIIVYQGVNDAKYGKPEVGTLNEEVFKTIESKCLNDEYVPTTFAEAYVAMIYRMKNRYEEADIFCITLPNYMADRDSTLLQGYNKIIRQVAKYYKIDIVDLANSGMYVETGCIYATDNSDGVHPLAEGMDAMTQMIIDAMMKKYLN